jgi:cbb3-type cytochrome oxidase subunit 3
VLAVLAQILEHALQSLPNMLAVLVAALASVVAVSFFRGEATIFTPIYQVIIFITGTLSPILGLVGGIAIVYRAHRKQEWDQRELATLFSLLFFAIAYFIRLSPYVRGLL